MRATCEGKQRDSSRYRTARVRRASRLGNTRIFKPAKAPLSVSIIDDFRRAGTNAALQPKRALIKVSLFVKSGAVG